MVLYTVIYFTSGFIGRKIVRALYDYDARQNDDLNFKKGDRMEIVGNRYFRHSLFVVTCNECVYLNN